MTRQTIIDIASNENGVTEKPKNSNKTQYGKWYGLDGNPWCAMFVSWVYHQAGVPLGKIDSVKGYHYCPSAYNFWKKNNCLTSNPQKADIVLFDWTGDGKSDHTGIFLEWKVKGKTFTCWEGNTAIGNDSDGGQVMLRTRNVATVKAFVNPGVIDNKITTPSTDLKKGDIGSNVSHLQKQLFDLDYKITVDGEYGSETQKVVKQFQKDHGLEITGIANLITKKAIEAKLTNPNVAPNKLITGSFLRKGDSGAPVVALQKALNKSKIGVSLTVDGVFGNKTVQAVKDFQLKNKLQVDGIAGPKTLSKLAVKI